MLLAPARLLEKDALRQRLRLLWLADDREAILPLLEDADIGATKREEARSYAQFLIARLRAEQQGKGGVDALLNEFSLSTEEGVALMCLAEALLRVPDALTADKLIRDKLQAGNWASHLGHSDSMFVNASAWALLFTGKMVNYSDAQQRALHGSLKRASGRLGQPVIRAAVRRAMAIMGEVFVMGTTIEAAMDRAERMEARGYRYSYDMLGEGARSAATAQDYFDAYAKAIEAIGRKHQQQGPDAAAGISVKLSALHPRYEASQHARAVTELVPRLRSLALQARAYDIGLTVDAEEAARLDLSLDVIAAVFRDPALRGWTGFGVAVQAYQKRAPLLIDWLAQLARQVGRRMMVRLVKGAYWDSEIKQAQMLGLRGYPVFTRKPATDVCYQACARRLLGHRPILFPQFATHNAWSVAAILAMDAGHAGNYEFQRLHGMGAALYEQVMRDHRIPCRIYAPVGEHQDLLAYLVRRLLENGANSSFVNNIVDAHVSIDELVQDPVLSVRTWTEFTHPAIALPQSLYGEDRPNSRGLDLSDTLALDQLGRTMAGHWQSRAEDGSGQAVRNPARNAEIVGHLRFDSADGMRDKLDLVAASTHRAWPVAARVAFLRALTESLEAHREELILLCIKEAGKTVADSIAEVREAVDFCRYYAAQASRLEQAEPLGTVLCISPWNFPLAIFIGQVSAALAAGNAVLAKPAEQTSLIALRSLALMQACGLPANRMACVISPGPLAGETLVPDPRIRAVLFTGSTTVGRWLFDTLAQRRDGPIPLIAETGGQNAMIVDSTALPEQVVDDVIRSGFHSAGQRCSALRVLFLQDETADHLIEMIKGAMAELVIGDPLDLATDVGPVIDARALERLHLHVDVMAGAEGVKLLHTLPLPATLAAHGHFFAPRLYELDRLDRLDQEVFGPVVHVIRYQARDLEQVIAQINAAGFGLTLGVHSRIQRSAERIAAAAKVGNVYINRDMIGAVVGVQPFGGRGLSGTGPKAGGPLYLPALTRNDQGASRISAIDLRPRLMPGPTGERNLYQLEPRGSVLALYACDDPLAHGLATLDAALATGNRLKLCAPEGWREVLEQGRQHWLAQGREAQCLEIEYTLTWPQHLHAQQTLVLAPGSPLLPRALAELRAVKGPIPRLICQPAGENYWQRFVEEKVISSNTTAAGGNASLMTLRP